MLTESAYRIAAYDSGTQDAGSLNDKLPEAWRRLIADQKKRDGVAAALGLDPSLLDTTTAPPLRIEAGRAFIDPGTVAITVVTWFASEIFLKAFANVARAEVERRMKQAWALIEPELRGLFDERGALGPPSADEDKTTGPKS